MFFPSRLSGSLSKNAPTASKKREKAQNDKQKRFCIKRKENAEKDRQNISASKKENTPCLYCQENYSTCVESWVSCSDCHRWGQYSCASLEEKIKDNFFTCELYTNCE